MITALLSFRYEFTPVPSCGSVFVYMAFMRERVIPVRVYPAVSVPERDFHSGTKTHSDIV